MRAYADSSFILRLVSGESGTEAAVAEYRRIDRPGLFYLRLHALEVENAIRQRAFHEQRVRASKARPESRRNRDLALSRLSLLHKRGGLLEVALEMDLALDRARELSRKHGERIGPRAIDVLHIASALLLNSEMFLTFDERQLQLAKAEGLAAPRFELPP